MGHWTYLVLEVIWAGPIVIMQILLGLDVMLRRWKVWLPGIILPSLYLTAVDSVAIGGHTWTINPDLSSGILLPFGVPIEELVFFLLTNALVVQGVILFTTPGMWDRVRRLGQLIRRGPAALQASDSQPIAAPIEDSRHA